MAVKTGVGGLNLVVIYAIVSGAFDTTPLFTYDRVKGYTRVGHTKKKDVKINFEVGIDNMDLEEHLAAYLSESSSSDQTVAEVEYDDGSKEFGGQASTDTSLQFGVIAYESSFGGLVKVLVGIGTYTGATGDHKAAARTANMQPIEITLVETDTEVTIATGRYSTAKVAVAGAETPPASIPAGEVGVIKYVTAAS